MPLLLYGQQQQQKTKYPLFKLKKTSSLIFSFLDQSVWNPRYDKLGISVNLNDLWQNIKMAGCGCQYVTPEDYDLRPAPFVSNK